MTSTTQQTERRRSLRHKRAGTKRKHMAQVNSTPVFPIHPKGYDPNAPDAKGHKPSSNS